MAIPAKFFGKYDGQYDQNVYIMGKYSALDYETTEPINPLDGLMQKTKYGPDVECGKGFPMSWSSRWEEWLGFDTMRGPSGGSLLNRQTTSGILGVCILGTNPSWTDNPLNMVNYYALGRLSWNTSLTTAEIHEEFVRRSFGAALPPAASRSILSVLSDSETAADDLGIYRGYRGVWYKFCEGDHCSGPGLRSKPVNNQVLSKSGAGMPKPLAADLLSHYSAGVRAIYSNHSDPRSEKSLLEWGVFPLTYRLQNGRTLIEDMALRPSEGLATAISMRDSWRTAEAAVRAAVGDAYYEATDAELQEFVVIATEMVGHLRTALALLHPIPPAPPPTP
jgi:alpha-glucuronidase